MNTVTSRDGTTIAFDVIGGGSPVILVGGAFQRRADPMFVPLAVQLSEHFAVIEYDRRGRGDSADTSPYAVEREVEDIAALIAAVGRPAALFGMSSGAVLALDAAQGGLPIPRLALYEPPFIVDATRPAVPDDYLDRLAAALSAGRRGDAVALFMTAVVGLPPEAVEGMRGQPFWADMEGLAHTLPYDGALMAGTCFGRPLPVDRWSSISVPALVMDGADSPAYQHSAVDALVRLLPGARRRSLPGQTHQVDPEVLAPVLSAFFMER